MYDQGVTKVNANISQINAIDTKIASTTGFISKTQFNSEKQNLERKIHDVDEKIPNTSGLINKIDLNTNNYRN